MTIMSETLQRNQERLDNIKVIEPLLGALRTISLGAWRASLAKKTSVEKYVNNLSTILDQISLVMKDIPDVKTPEAPVRIKNKLIIVIGSGRGLCGKFDINLLDQLEEEYLEQPRKHLWVWLSGDRLVRSAEQRGMEIQWSIPMSGKSYPTYSSVYAVTRRILKEYAQQALDEVHVLYNRYENAGKYRSSSEQLLPLVVSAQKASQKVSDWPEPIIETEPLAIYKRVVEQLIATSLYGYFLNSSASEHSTRYSLMEEAGKNAARMIEELNLVVQIGRRQAITQEMQELAAGAGLIR